MPWLCVVRVYEKFHMEIAVINWKKIYEEFAKIPAILIKEPYSILHVFAFSHATIF